MRAVEKEEVIFKKYYKSLCHFAWQLLHDVEGAEDVVQDAFIAYFNKKDTISSDESAIRQFLYTSVKHACYNISRRQKVDEKYMSSLAPMEGYESDIEFKIIKAEVLSEVCVILETMPESRRKIFEMGYLQGFSVKEIAEELEVSVSTVKTQQQRALKVVMGRLNPEFLAFFLVFLKNF